MAEQCLQFQQTRKSSLQFFSKLKQGGITDKPGEFQGFSKSLTDLEIDSGESVFRNWSSNACILMKSLFIAKNTIVEASS